MTQADNGRLDLLHDVPRQPGLLVILGGLLTTGLALGLVILVSYASDGTFDLMGYYLWYIVPVSAIGLGVLAGCGYSLVSWLRGIRVMGWLLAVVLVLTVCAYFAAHYVEYAVTNPRYEDGTAVPFWTYFDLVTRSITFKSSGESESGSLGAWGYGVRVVQILGFSLGGLVPLFLLWAVPYCKACHAYMRTKALCLIPAAAPSRKVGRKDSDGQAAFAKEHAEAEQQAAATLEQIAQAVEDKDASRLAALVQAHQAQAAETAKRAKRFELKLRYCPICHKGQIAVALVTGKGEKTVREEQAAIPAGADLLREYLNAQPGQERTAARPGNFYSR